MLDILNSKLKLPVDYAAQTEDQRRKAMKAVSIVLNSAFLWRGKRTEPSVTTEHQYWENVQTSLEAGMATAGQSGHRLLEIIDDRTLQPKAKIERLRALAVSMVL